MTEYSSVFEKYAKGFILTDSQNQNVLREDLQVDTDVPGLLHSVLGIVSEISELEQSVTKYNRDEEIGDLVWFISRGMYALGMPVGRAWESACASALLRFSSNPNDLDYRELRLLGCQLVDRVKSILFYQSTVVRPYCGWKHPAAPDKQDYKEVMVDLMFRAAASVVVLLYMLDVEDVEGYLANIMEKNLAKLQARHGAKKVIDDIRDYAAEEKAVQSVDSRV